jgi:predicted DNA-binding protein (MmcQ/YjbR family)
MTIEELRDLCLSVKGATECLPFDDTTLVYKVMNKMFVYFSLNPKGGDFFANMKCAPEKSQQLMERYQGITFGYYSDKRYWITVYLNSDVPDSLIKELVLHSVNEVINKLSKSKREEYAQMLQ